ncbi:MAG: ATP-dependent sacrificial sulfur transferase LarE [Candidatus Altiarchaeota archaeon]
MPVLELKYKKLEGIIKRQGSAVVAFSGGVDSSVLAAVAFRILGNKVAAITLDSPAIPRSELTEARKIARFIGIRHVVLKHDELENKNFARNGRQRCYYCKRMLSQVLRKHALKTGFYGVLEGTNASELKGHRPGYRALKEKGVVSPLAVAGLTKEEVRLLAKKLRLPSYNKPSMACLSSRIPYGKKITLKALRSVEKAEAYLKWLGVGQARVRCFEDIAVLEVLPRDFRKVIKHREKISEGFRKIGFMRVALDLQGYRTGSMN